MRKIITLALLFISLIVSAQTAPPQLISYRATALNGTTIIANQAIGIEIRILDAPTSTTPIYIEHFNLTTDATGGYNLNIGGGTSTSGTTPIFSNIVWGTGNKYLQVKIDPAGGTSYTAIQGTTQLLSVPYALYAKTAESSANTGDFQIVKNIDALKALPVQNTATSTVPSSDNKLVYVKGYYTEGDGGEGFFIYKAANAETINYGTVFKYNGNVSNTAGRWIRKYSGYMNVGYFGAMRDGLNTSSANNSTRIQDMINYASANSHYSTENDVTIYFPNGQYFIEAPLVIKDYVKILGTPGTLLTNNNAHYDYMFTLDVGPVTNIRIEDIMVNCNYQCGGFLFKAAYPPSGTQQGGLWSAFFKNIEILTATKPGMYFQGCEASSHPDGHTEILWSLPNQFIICENVRAHRTTDIDPALKMTGYNANVTFLNCEFNNSQLDGSRLAAYPAGECIYIGSLDPAPNQQGSEAVSFINSGFGVYATYGAIIENSSNITFDSGFYEGLDIAFEIKDCEQITIVNNRFANAAGAGSLASSFSHTGNAGRIISAKHSIVNVWNNRIDVTGDNYPALANQSFILGLETDPTTHIIDNVFNIHNNSFKVPGLAKTSGVVQIVAVKAPDINNLNNHIDTWSKKVVFVTVPATYSASTNDIKTINSDLSTGETIFIRANQGTLKFWPMDTTETQGKNIFLNGRTSLTLNNGQGALFIKLDDNAFELVSVAD